MRRRASLAAIFGALKRRAVARNPKLKPLRLRTCKVAEREHAARWRQFAHTGHKRNVLCYSRAMNALPATEKLGILVHEVGHASAMAAGNRHTEAQANRIGTAVTRVPVRFAGPHRLERSPRRAVRGLRLANPPKRRSTRKPKRKFVVRHRKARKRNPILQIVTPVAQGFAMGAGAAIGARAVRAWNPKKKRKKGKRLCLRLGRDKRGRFKKGRRNPGSRRSRTLRKLARKAVGRSRTRPYWAWTGRQGSVRYASSRLRRIRTGFRNPERDRRGRFVKGKRRKNTGRAARARMGSAIGARALAKSGFGRMTAGARADYGKPTSAIDRLYWASKSVKKSRVKNPIRRITSALVRRYADTGQVQARVGWIDHKGKRGSTVGAPTNAHMKALIARARRQGIRVKRKKNPLNPRRADRGRPGQRIVSTRILPWAQAKKAKGFAAAMKGYVRFHGAKPAHATLVRISDGSKRITRRTAFAMGQAPEASYQTLPGQRSTKAGKNGRKVTFVHRMGEKGGRKPLLIHDPRSGVTSFLGGTYRVSDWMHR